MALLPWTRWKAHDAEDAREIDVHLDLEAEDRVDLGASPSEARLAARRKFGSVAFTREEMRTIRTGAFGERLWRDVSYALRLLGRSPGFTTVAVFTLALAVAANTAIFSVVDGVMLRPLAFKNSERLVSIVRVIASRPGISGIIAAVHFGEWRRSSRSFEALAMIGGGPVSLTGSGEPESVGGARVSANLFSMLGVTMQLGRSFLQEDEDQRSPVAIISHALWRRRFAADAGIVGRSIGIGGTPYTIIGVLPETFRFPSINQLYFAGPGAGASVPEIWTPIAPAPFELDPRAPIQNYAAIGRLRPGTSLQQANADLNGLQVQLAKLSLDGHVSEISILLMRDYIAQNYRTGLLLIWASVGALLLISCVNVASLLLARSARRRREIAIRSALGASRAQIARQLLIESFVLSALSGALGFAAAYWFVRAIIALAPADVPRIGEVSLDWRVLIFLLAIVVVDAVLFGVMPAWRSSSAHPQDAMRFDARTSSAHESIRLRAALVSTEVGLCALGLLIGGLLLQSFSRVLHIDRGFDVDGIQTVSVSLPATRYPVPKRAQFLQQALERIQHIRGVQIASMSSFLPLLGGTGPALSVTAVGQSRELPTAYLRAVDAEYFRTFGIPLEAGRLFREEDRKAKPVIVSSLLAKRLWPNQPAIGKQFRIGPPTTSLFLTVFEVVGVVGDAHAESLTSAIVETLYVPYWQDLSFTQGWWFVMKTSDPVETAREVRAVLRDLDANLPIPAFRSMDNIVSGSVGQRRFQMNIVLAFAVVSLLLASMGIYGVVAYSVTQRTNEMGIRMALGAKAGAIRRLVVRQGLAPLVPGLIAGIAAAIAAERFFATLLYGVSPRDPITIASVAGLLVGVGLAASYVPARRATRIDPVTSLRYE